MTRQEAVNKLSSDSGHERLKAARFFARNSEPSDQLLLHNALKRETILYVRSSLELASKRVFNAAYTNGESISDEYEIPPEVRSRIIKDVTKEVTGMLLHEISSSLGLLTVAAKREIPNFETSKTRKFIRNLRRTLDGIEQLKCTVAVPRSEECDLADLLREVVSDEVENMHVDVSLQGAAPMLIFSDCTLLRMAISNGMRNALEAVSSALERDPHPIIVTWGETDVDYWVSILDRGPGVTGTTESAFRIGSTTKTGHSGFGLAVARRAIETLGGTCTLSPGTTGGARFEIRWER